MRLKELKKLVVLRLKEKLRLIKNLLNFTKLSKFIVIISLRYQEILSPIELNTGLKIMNSWFLQT